MLAVPASALHKAIGPDHRAALAWSRRALGQTRTALHTHFATTAPSAALDFIATAKADHVRRALEGTEWADLPVLGTAAPYRVGGRGGPDNYTDIPAGVLRMRHLSDLYMFPNTLVALSMSGADVADWLERSVALFRQITPGATDAPLHDNALPSFTFDVIPGLSYGIDLSQPPRFDPAGALVNPNVRRVLGLSFQGQPLAADRRFVIVTNSHRASLARSGMPQGDGPASKSGAETDTGGAGANRPLPKVLLSQGIRARQVLEDHVRRHGSIGAPPVPGWHFLPMPGTTLCIRAGQGAEPHLADIAHLRPQRLDDDAEGFAHYRLHL